MTETWIITVIAAYLIGSVPFGVLIGRMRGVDIRSQGSRNIGATNVGRVLGRKLGLLCFLLDVAKGAGSVIGAGLIMDLLGRPIDDVTPLQMGMWLAVGVAAVVGHMYSIFLRFGGGKGVATGFGALAGMWPLLTFPALAAFVVWYATLRLTKYVSVASMLAALSLPVWSVMRSVPNNAQDIPFTETLRQIGRAAPLHLTLLFLACLVVWKHRGNIARLRRGEETKVGRRAQQGDLLSTDSPPDQTRDARDADG